MRYALALALLLPLSARAGVEGRYVESLRNHGYKCVPTPKKDGTFCTKGISNVTIPNDLETHKRTVYYAHGLVGVCGNGASGENYLKNESPTLRKIGAIAVMPYRENAHDQNFPLTTYLKQFEYDLGGEPAELVVSGHSAAGSYLGRSLNANPKVLKRVIYAQLLDAVYSVDVMVNLWTRALAGKRDMKVKFISSTTKANTRDVVAGIKERFPDNVSVETKTEGHCEMPKYFSLLADDLKLDPKGAPPRQLPETPEN